MNFNIIPEPWSSIIFFVSLIGLVVMYLLGRDGFALLLDWIERKFNQIQEDRKPQLVTNKKHGDEWGVTWAVCSREAFERACLERDAKIKAGEQVPKFVEVIGETMTFTDMDRETMDPANHTTGSLHDMEELLKGCKKEFNNSLYVPFSSKNSSGRLKHRVNMGDAHKIIKSARPKHIRNFLRRHRSHFQAATTGIVGLFLILGVLCVERWYSGSAVIPRGQYAVGYHTRHGYVPQGQTFEELKKDPAVWGIIWTEKTPDPNVELWYDWQCGQGFWSNRCEFVSYALPINTVTGRPITAR